MIEAIAYDGAGNESPAETLEVIFDPGEPEIVNINPSDGSRVYSADVEFRGRADEEL